MLKYKGQRKEKVPPCLWQNSFARQEPATSLFFATQLFWLLLLLLLVLLLLLLLLLVFYCNSNCRAHNITCLAASKQIVRLLLLSSPAIQPTSQPKMKMKTKWRNNTKWREITENTHKKTGSKIGTASAVVSAALLAGFMVLCGGRLSLPLLPPSRLSVCLSPPSSAVQFVFMGLRKKRRGRFLFASNSHIYAASAFFCRRKIIKNGGELAVLNR